MAKEPRRGNRRSNADAAPPETPARERIIDAMMALLAETPYGRIGLGDIAEAAGVSLATLREAFAGKLGIVAAFMRRIDIAVLAGGAPDMETGPRDRLFEAEMRRLDALSPYREAVRGLADSARSDPGLACALHRLAARSQKWTLVAAGIDHGGVLGRLGVEGAVLIHADTMRTWLGDDDPDLSRTMAALDRSLRRGERAMRFLGGVCSVVPRVAACGRRMRDSGRDRRMADRNA